MKQSNKFIIGLFSVLCILYSQPSFAWDYSATGTTTEQSVQLRSRVLQEMEQRTATEPERRIAF